MINVLKLNNISGKINEVFDNNYAFSTDCADPELILVRSAQMADYPVEDKLLAVGRAGAGVNNIPHAAYVKKGIAVFNAPGANANAVKELVIAALLLSGRKLYEGIHWAASLKNNGDEAKKMVEKGKSQFVGHEITGKTLGIIGMGAIGRLVAEAASALGMKIVGYDPFLNKKLLAKPYLIVNTLEELYEVSDFITIHVPYTPQTNGFINKTAIAKMKDGAVVINCARGELVDNADIIESVRQGKIYKYFTDFPSADILGIDNIIATPHLGASTPEAEDNCAVMVSGELKDYYENGNIKNSVNFPAVTSPRDGHRITALTDGNPDTLSAIKAALADSKISVKHFVSAEKGAAGYVIADTDDNTDGIADKLAAINGVYKARVIA